MEILLGAILSLIAAILIFHYKNYWQDKVKSKTIKQKKLQELLPRLTKLQDPLKGFISHARQKMAYNIRPNLSRLYDYYQDSPKKKWLREEQIPRRINYDSYISTKPLELTVQELEDELSDIYKDLYVLKIPDLDVDCQNIKSCLQIIAQIEKVSNPKRVFGLEEMVLEWYHLGTKEKFIFDSLKNISKKILTLARNFSN